MATVTHTYTYADGHTPLTGTVTLTRYDTDDQHRLTATGTIDATLDTTGSISVTLTDDGIYAVVEKLRLFSPNTYVVVATTSGDLHALPRFATVRDAWLATASGQPGPAGTGVQSATVDSSGNLTINLTDGRTQGPWNVQGPQGPQGPQGEPGVGVPAGGTTGQLLTKASDGDYDTAWTSPA